MTEKKKRTFKYRFLLKAIGLLPVRKIMASPPEKTQKLFRKAYKGENIPDLHDPELDIFSEKVNGCSVLCFRHKTGSQRLGIYLVGGGMLKYPKPGQAREVLQLAKKSGRDMMLPYYPIIFNGATLPDVYEMIYTLYKQALEKYKPESICIMGGSSGGNLAIGMASYINGKGEGLPLPGKIYASSPGTLLITDEEKAFAHKLEKTDVVMSVKATDSVWDGMTGGKGVPSYMKHLQLGDYTGLKDVYMSFGGDEVFLAGAQCIKKRLEEYCVHVTLEVGEGMFHSYAMMPLVKDAQDGYERFIRYISE